MSVNDSRPDGWVYRGGQSSAAKLIDLIEFKCIYLEMITPLSSRDDKEGPGPDRGTSTLLLMVTVLHVS